MAPVLEHAQSAIRRHAFTVDDYYEMARAGILKEDDRVELIEGDIIAMNPIGPMHAGYTDVIARNLSDTLKNRAQIRIQGPIRLNDESEPQPDIAVLKPARDKYTKRHPRPGDVFFLIEVADTTQRYDRAVKVPLYARAGIPEVWLIDLTANTIEIFRDPAAEGYKSAATLAAGDPASPAAFPDFTLRLGELLGG